MGRITIYGIWRGPGRNDYDPIEDRVEDLYLCPVIQLNKLDKPFFPIVVGHGPGFQEQKPSLFTFAYGKGEAIALFEYLKEVGPPPGGLGAFVPHEGKGVLDPQYQSSVHIQPGGTKAGLIFEGVGEYMLDPYSYIRLAAALRLSIEHETAW